MRKYSVFIICIFLIVVFLGLTKADDIPPPPEPNKTELESRFSELLSHSITMEVSAPLDLLEGRIGQPVDYRFPIKLSVGNTSFTDCLISIDKLDRKTGKIESALHEQSIDFVSIKNLRTYGKVEFTKTVSFSEEGKYQVVFNVKCQYDNRAYDAHDVKDVKIISEPAYIELKTAIKSNEILQKTNSALIIITLASVIGSVIISPIISAFLSEFLSRKSMNKINKNLNKIASSIPTIKKKPKRK